MVHLHWERSPPAAHCASQSDYFFLKQEVCIKRTACSLFAPKDTFCRFSLDIGVEICYT